MPGAATAPVEREPLPPWPLTLVIVRRDGVVRRELPRRGVLRIGRDPSAEIHLDDGGVSRLHAELELEERVRVRDMGSYNGTRLGGRKLSAHEEVVVCHDEAIEVGSTLLLVHPKGQEPASLRARLATPAASPGIVRLRSLCDHAAGVDDGVVFVGETGVGKTTLARMLHGFSRRRGRPFELLDCAASTATELEAALIGTPDGPGLLVTVRGGTLLLREPASLPVDLQARLVTALDRGELRPPGSKRAQAIDVRIMASCREDPANAAREGLLRRELLYRLSRITIAVPPLRERMAEFPALVDEALQRECRTLGRSVPMLTPELMQALTQHDWPGNLRELGDRLAQALVVATGETLDVDDLSMLDTASMPAAAPESPEEAERRRILEALGRCAGNQSQAAKMLGISRRTLVSRLDKYGLPRPRKRGR